MYEQLVLVVALLWMLSGDDSLQCRHSVTRPALSLAYISQCCLCILKSQDTAVTRHIFETESDNDSSAHLGC